ncbi:MAG: M23 family metallopeptidase [Candidatus Falkowbacteria bacterium]
MPSPLHGDHTKNAVDFYAPTGSSVLAALDGVVSDYRDMYCSGGTKAKYRSQYNFVLIRHKFEEFSHYVHLEHKSAAVRIGECVSTGQPIGRVGETGFTSYPHLHFDTLRYGKNGAVISLRPRIISAEISLVPENFDRFEIDRLPLERIYWFIKKRFTIARKKGAILAFSSKASADAFIVDGGSKDSLSFYLTHEETVLMLKNICPRIMLDGEYDIQL